LTYEKESYIHIDVVLGADQLVSGAVSIAKKFKVSDFVIGAAIVGVVTSSVRTYLT
jgi:Ca2+/Na+ antiporter